MAFRYQKRAFESGDVIDPDDWNLNHTNFAEEFNGNLDRDNFPANFIKKDMLAANACNQFWSTSSSTDSSALVSSTTDWQYEDVDNTNISRRTIEVEADALLMVEWSGGWKWSYDATDSDWLQVPGTESSPTSVTLKRDPTSTLCRFRLSVDGMIVSETGFSSARRARDSAYLVGAVPVVAGSHIVQLEAQLVYLEQSLKIVEQDHLNMNQNTSYFVGADFTFTMKQRELLIRARYR